MSDEDITPAIDLKRLAAGVTCAGARGVRFAVGVVAGMLLVPVAALGVAAVLLAAILVVGLSGKPPAQYAESYLSAGRDIARLGGASVVWERSSEVVRQTCRGACDDLAFAYEAPKAAEVRASDGRVLVSRPAPWPLALLAGDGPDKRPQLLRGPELRP